MVELSSSTPRSRPDESLGVIAMGIKHADRIDEALRTALADGPSSTSSSTTSRDEPFFVKNLERVQGDERDAIILPSATARTPTDACSTASGRSSTRAASGGSTSPSPGPGGG